MISVQDIKKLENLNLKYQNLEMGTGYDPLRLPNLSKYNL